jgi:hypothetical protein
MHARCPVGLGIYVRTYLRDVLTLFALCNPTQGGEDCRVRVVVDRLRREERRMFGGALRRYHVRPDDVRGARDQSDAFIRLADAVCGLIRDAEDGQDWAVQASERLKRRGLIIEQ